MNLKFETSHKTVPDNYVVGKLNFFADKIVTIKR